MEGGIGGGRDRWREGEVGEGEVEEGEVRE